MNVPTIILRSARINDLEEILTLFVETVKTVCRNDYSPEQINVWTSSSNDSHRWLNKLEKQYFIVAEIEHKMAGYASLENNHYLDLLYVHKDFQRLGVASKLYDHIEAEAIRQGATILHSDVSLTAKTFFEKKGFTTITKQTKKIAGVEISNFNMRKTLQSKK